MLSKSKLVALLLVGAVGVGTGVGELIMTLGPAGATANGVDYVTPGAGNPSSQLTVTTNGFCPSGNTTFDVSVAGTGEAGHPIIAPNQALPNAGATGYSAVLTETMAQWASEQSTAATLSGAYEFDFNCFATPTDVNPDYTFAGDVTFSGSGSGDANTYTNTATTLTINPPVSAVRGSTFTLTATMTPSTAAGTVQFMNGNTALGTPVTVAGGVATYKVLGTFGVGNYSLSADFAPATSDTSNTWGTSKSAAVRYSITFPPPVFIPTVFGTAKVGDTVTCVQSVFSAQSEKWSWLNGTAVISGATAQTYKIPTTLSGKKLSCVLAATNGTGTTTGTSPQVTVAA